MILRLLLTVLLLASASTAHAEPVFPRGGRIGVEVPEGLAPSARFAGFEDTERKVTVELIEVPRAGYGGILESIFSNEVGARDIKRESFPYRNGIGYLVSGDVTEGGVTQRRFFLIASPIGVSDNDDLVGFIRVAVPEAARGHYSDDAIRTMLASMTFRQMPVEEQLAQLPYVLRDLAGFRVARIMPPATVLLVDGDANGGGGGQIDLSRQSHIIISVGAGSAASADDRGRLARKLMEAAPLRDIRLQLAEPLRIENAPGYEIRAQAQTPNDRPVSLVQWVRFGSSGYMQIVGISPRASWEQLFPRFRAVRDGIGPR